PRLFARRLGGGPISLPQGVRAPPPEVLPPRERLGLRQPPRDEAEDLRRRLTVVVVPTPDEVPVAHVQLQPEVEVAALLARKPRLPPEPACEVARQGLGVVDRKQRVPLRPRQLPARPPVHEPPASERRLGESDVGELLVGVEQD